MLPTYMRRLFEEGVDTITGKGAPPGADAPG
jgi:hypothetical protein